MLRKLSAPAACASSAAELDPSDSMDPNQTKTTCAHNNTQTPKFDSLKSCKILDYKKKHESSVYLTLQYVVHQ